MINTLAYSDTSQSDASQSNNSALNQMEFFLFLANSVEIDGELTTLVDLETVDPETLAEQEAKALETTESTEHNTQQNDANLNNRSNINQQQEEQL